MDLKNRLKVADRAIKLLERHIAAEGPVRVDGEQVWAGANLLNGHKRIVDAVYDATLFGTTIFLGNVRIATRATAKGNNVAAIGTTANDEVTQLVFVGGNTFRGATKTLGKSWAIVYVPFLDHAGVRIGMLAAFRELVGGAHDDSPL